MRRGIVEKFEQGPSVSPTVQFHVVKTRIYSLRIPRVRADNVIAFRSDYNVSHSARSLTEIGKNIDLRKRGDIHSSDKVGIFILTRFVNIAFVYADI